MAGKWRERRAADVGGEPCGGGSNYGKVGVNGSIRKEGLSGSSLQGAVQVATNGASGSSWH